MSQKVTRFDDAWGCLIAIIVVVPIWGLIYFGAKWVIGW